MIAMDDFDDLDDLLDIENELFNNPPSPAGSTLSISRYQTD